MAGLAHGMVHAVTELLLNLPQFGPRAFADRLRFTENRPNPFFPLLCVR
jgi:hypothetical protein